MRNLLSNRNASVYAVVAFFLALIFFAVLWFFMYSEDGFVTKVVDATSSIHSSLESDTHPLYANSVNFMASIMKWILILVMFGLFIAGIVYTQRKRAEIYQ